MNQFELALTLLSYEKSKEVFFVIILLYNDVNQIKKFQLVNVFLLLGLKSTTDFLLSLNLGFVEANPISQIHLNGIQTNCQ